MYISTVSQMKKMDEAATEQFGIPEGILMENAGDAVCAVIKSKHQISGKQFTIVCGNGNNGGDGFVVARKLYSMGGNVSLVIMGDPDKYGHAAKLNYEIVRKLPLHMYDIASIDEGIIAIETSDIIIDAIFGTGLTRDVSGIYRDIIELINCCEAEVVSLDIPSGICGDTGRVMGAAVKADYTVSFGAPKAGNLLFPGYEFCNELFVSNISFPPELIKNSNLFMQVNIPPKMPERNPNGHKGSFGKALFVAGSRNYFGAPYLSAFSFLKAGGGYSRLAAPAAILPFITVKCPEVVIYPMEETDDGSLSLNNLPSLLHLSKQADVVALGPGVSLNEQTKELMRKLAGLIEGPVIIDGDGLIAVSEDLTCLANRKIPAILTPHPGEMAYLAGSSIADVERDRVGILRRTAAELNSYVVLKGAHSLICSPDKSVYVNMSGNSGMGTAGSGDVLTGVLAAMIGFDMPLLHAVCNGIFLHGLAGDIAAEELGEDGIIASDILNFIPGALRLRRAESVDFLAKNKVV